MTGVTLENVLEQVRQLPFDDRQKLLEKLTEEIRQQPQTNGKRVPLPVPYKDRSREYEWLKEHAREYAGQWVALEGDRLIAHGANAAEVFAAADASGVERPFLLRVEDPDGPPFAGV